MKKRPKWILGVDEAGRGPLAGPVAVGVVLVPLHFDWDLLPGVGDSKKVSVNNRERIYRAALKLAKEGKLWCTVELTPATMIDKRGIVSAICTAMDKGLRTVFANCQDHHYNTKTISMRRDLVLDWADVEVKLDGSLKAPEYCVQQETIIKGDVKEKVIGLASILAKVTRDHYMVSLGDRPVYKKYHFARHKGYGTAAHRTAISTYGLSPEHRKSFCRNIKSMA